jgi:hypothetical protein
MEGVAQYGSKTGIRSGNRDTHPGEIPVGVCGVLRGRPRGAASAGYNRGPEEAAFQLDHHQRPELPDGSWITELKDPIKVLEYILQSDANALFVLRDYHHYLNDPVVVRKLRDAAHALKTSRKNILFLSPVLKAPTELEKEIAVIDYKLPDKEEIREIISWQKSL